MICFVFTEINICTIFVKEKLCFFLKFKENLPLLPRQHLAYYIGLPENDQPIEGGWVGKKTQLFLNTRTMATTEKQGFMGTFRACECFFNLSRKTGIITIPT